MSTILPCTTAPANDAAPDTITPPAWVLSGPDSEDGYDGPVVAIADRKIVGAIGWHPTEGTAAWFDALLYKGAPLNSYELRLLALWAMKAAEILDDDLADALSGPRPSSVTIQTAAGEPLTIGGTLLDNLTPAYRRAFVASIQAAVTR